MDSNNVILKNNFGKMKSNWPILTLDDVCLKEKGSIISGPFGSNISSKFFTDKGIPVIRGNNLSEDLVRFIDNGFVYVTKEKADSLKTYAKVNDLIFTAAGTIGQVGIITSKCKYSEYIISNKQLRARLNNNIVDPLYAYYWFSSPKMNKYIKMLNTGSTIPLINLSVLRRLIIPVPEIKVQRSIVSILNSIDEKIELNNQINKNLQSLAKLIFKHWFIDFEFPNEEGLPYKSSGGEMVESKLATIPNGWRVGILDDLCTKIASGGTPSTKMSSNYIGDINWFSTKELKDNFLIDSEKHINKDAISNSSAKLFPSSTILMAIYASPTVGRLAILTKESSFNQAAVGLISNETVSCMEYLYLLLLNERNNLNNLANGAAQQNLNVSLVKNYKCLCPEINIILNFKKVVKPIFTKIKSNTMEIKRLIEIRDTLLPKLMNGEIDLSNIELNQ